MSTPWSNQSVTLIILNETTTGFSGIFLYAGAPAQGNLIGSWAVVAGTDPYGNTYPAGLYVAQGSITGTAITGATLTNCTLQGDILTGTAITQPSISGGTATAQDITFVQGAGGEILVYSSSTTTATISTSGAWSAPAGTYTSGLVEVWGADAGGGGGNATQGGEGGGGGAYAQEPNYPLTPGNSYQVTVGQAGTGGTSNNAGTSGGQSSFDNQGVIANGGHAGSGGTGGAGGAVTGATVSYAGGAGGNGNLGVASAGGGGRAGSTGAGGAGGNGGSSGGAAGAAGTGTGGHAGGAGVASNTNGNAGGGGSGAGAASGSVNISKSYRPTSTQSYYGSGVGSGLKNSNGYMFQGDPNVPANVFPGDEASIANYSHATIASDFSGATIDSVTLAIFCAGSWYNSGCYAILGYYDGSNHTSQQVFWCNNGATTTADITTAFKTVIATTMTGLILGPGGVGFLYNYGYFNGGPSSGPLLSITGHTGSTPKQAGAGANGQVKVTYATSPVLIAAIAPVAGTDASSNAYGASFTGQVKAFQPGASPSAVEAWHTLGTINSWVSRGAGYCTPRYRLTPDNEVEIQFEMTNSVTTTSAAVATLPAAYTPVNKQDFPVGVFMTGTSSNPPAMQVSNNGTLTVFSLVGTTSLVQACIRCPLD